ncbi:type IX secretion system membrane protein PorP/SprF [Taibaiella lutea]|uniref:Type IX secretion system membrane protein PorP/SprF n=1 Tax=Taibaiella lutea TaxID=2608001 RepID=A0A5M6CHV5_9BACT|nr:PorP/SprF family type IX secretion system membrane protein [Taibaiella lutea]KAA5533532.1 type IX secretion system membrane protein PorP/SprF [Taibaiella lutea]
MKCRITFAGVGLIVAAMLNSGNAQAQDVHFTQFDASPLTLNPANTGAFGGDFRASAIYRDQWRSVTGGDAAFKTIGVSLDMPIIRDISVDDYLAAGLQFYKDQAGDGNLSNTTVMLSLAYHKFLGTDGKKVLTVGLQGGYSHKNIDLSKLYFGDEYLEGAWQPGTSAEWGWLTTGTSNYLINAGINYSQAIGEKSSFVIGVGANNLNQPLESFDKRQAAADVGLGIRYTGQLGAIIGINDKFSLRPAAFVQSQSTAMELVAGNEFNLKVGEGYDLPTATAIYAGIWYRNQDAIMVTAGIEYQGFRIGVGYDYNTSDLKAASNNNGGFEISIRYIKSSPIDFAKKLLYPCSRF